jgi:hypothetical protein
MISYSDLKIDSEYLLKGFYLRPGWKLDIRVRVVAFCPQSVCFAMTFRDANTSRLYRFNVSNYLWVEFRDFLHVYPLCRRSKHLRSNSRVVLFGCDTILEALLPLDTK